LKIPELKLYDLKSKTTPFRFVTPRVYSKPGETKAPIFYFKTREAGREFLARVARDGAKAIYSDSPIAGTASASRNEEMYELSKTR
jgi:hypothetical protein